MRLLVVSKYVKSKFHYSDKHSARYVRGARHVNHEAKCPLLKSHLNQNWTLSTHFSINFQYQISLRIRS
jgi:hypothetical protein